ncbi:hypothetical protein OS493_027941 [Desmophyllum pertusum]|uniref:G-protein coupled receptors family 1 profile domain-containing protein n=1 Tax=Desmophyllum pertusum TaxID=174260 RepID=A0A9W9YKJ6_9CNID|nr:hypothetical protein OS493_027941 [Desmophyllum pertusum]
MNSSEEQSTFPTTLQAAGYTVLYAITILVALTGNILLIFIIKRKPETRSLTGFLFVNMAVADLLVTLVAMPVSVAWLYTGGKWLPGILGQATCTPVYFSYYVTLAASILSLAFMSVDRFLAVVFPLRRFPTFRRAKVLTVVIWLSSMIFSIPIAVVWRAIDFGPWGTYCTPVFKNLGELGMPLFYTYLFLIMYLIPLLVISSLYALVGHALWRRHVPGQLSTGTEKRNEKTTRKVVRMLVVITAVFAFCWLPTQCYHFVLAFYPDVHNNISPVVMFLCFWSGHANSAVNPWLYMMLSQKFRKALCDVVHRRDSRYGSRAQSTKMYTTMTETKSVRRQHANHEQANLIVDKETTV